MYGYDSYFISAWKRAPATQSGREENHHSACSRAILAGDCQKARGWHGNGISGRSGAFQNCFIITLGAFQFSAVNPVRSAVMPLGIAESGP